MASRIRNRPGSEWPDWWDLFCDSQNVHELPTYPRVIFEQRGPFERPGPLVEVKVRQPRRVPTGHRQRVRYADPVAAAPIAS